MLALFTEGLLLLLRLRLVFRPDKGWLKAMYNCYLKMTLASFYVGCVSYFASGGAGVRMRMG